MTERILIDTDPGIDDAMALLFALRAPELEVVGLTTVYGNHYVETTTRNALRLLELVGRDEIPVAMGASGPLVREYEGPPTAVHGQDGLGDAGLAGEPRGGAHRLRAAEFIVEMLLRSPGEITLVPVGPLTNLALALKLEPRIAQAARRVVLMGGTFLAPGNVTPVAEANIYNDPEAAAIVFGAVWPLVMVGLDVTSAVVMDRAYVADLCAAGNVYTDVIARCVPHYQQFYDAFYNSGGSIHTHDPSAIAYLINPSLFKTVKHRVRVAEEGLARGQVIVDRLGKTYTGVETEICVEVDAPGVLALYRERLIGHNA